MIVKCIDDISCEKRITNGRKYVVIRIVDKFYDILDNDGYARRWYQDRFINSFVLNKNIKIL